jgi:GxxExxY protein
MTENDLAKVMVNIFLQVHRTLGPGLLESVYESAICHELDKIEIKYSKQKDIQVFYDNVKLNLGFRADLIIDNKLIVEIKSVEEIAPIHQKQLLTYLKLTNTKLGLLVNFNVVLIKNGITRIVNNL